MNNAAPRNVIAIGRSRYLHDAIRRLSRSGYTFCAIVTEEAYEEYDVKDSDFRALAQEIGAAFFMTKDVGIDEIRKLVSENRVRVAISANWKYTIPQSFLDLFECGILNFHLGNLPDYKGNATPNWTIINGEPFIHGNIHRMAAVLDAGDVISRRKIEITPQTYIADLIRQAEAEAPSLYEEAVAKALSNPGACEIEGTTRGLRCYPRLPEDGLIDWKLSAGAIARLVRASSRPYKGAYTFLDGERVTIWRASAHVPDDPFLAVPGHVVEIGHKTGTVKVACGEAMLVVEEIEYKGQVVRPTEVLKSIRVRFKQA